MATHTNKLIEASSSHSHVGDSFSRLLFEGCKHGAVFHHHLADSSSPLFSLSPPNVTWFEELRPKIELGSSPIPDSTLKLGSLNGGDSGVRQNSKSNRKSVTGQVMAAAEGSVGVAGAPVIDGLSCKEDDSGASSTKGKRKKNRRRALGKGVAALHQLVCPHGKAHAATVLHEATGYIRFLQEQVKVLCLFYLQSQDQSDLHPRDNGGIQNKDCVGLDMRSKGLCLVPVEYIASLSQH